MHAVSRDVFIGTVIMFCKTISIMFVEFVFLQCVLELVKEGGNSVHL